MEILNMNIDTVSAAKKYWDERVSTLLDQLAKYEQKAKEYEAWKEARKKAEMEKPKKFKLGEGGWMNFGNSKPVNSQMERELAEIGDAMEFDNPYVWIKYKGLAYGNHTDPSKRMVNLFDFKEHMKKEVICPKRFEAVNRELKRRYKMDLSEGLVFSSTPLEAVADEKVITELSLDPDFISLWCAHEYDSHGKWSRWDKTRADGGIHRTGCC